MGDLKTLSHSTNYSIDRRGIGPPANARTLENNRYGSLTKLHNTKSASLNNKAMNSNMGNCHAVNGNATSNCTSTFNKGAVNVSPTYPVPPPRPASHQPLCSNVDAGQSAHYRYNSCDDRVPHPYDPPPSYEHANNILPHYRSGHDSMKYLSGNAADFPRYESLRNLPSDVPHTYVTSNTSQLHPLHSGGGGEMLRLGGSVTNLSRLGHSGSIQGLDRSGSSLVLDRSVSGSNLGLERGGRCGSVSGSLNELSLEDHHQTPSPSDSGVAELEAMLKEKDTEITTLRETMEQNEQVIFKVYEEKEKTWERELKKIRDLYDSRLKAAQQKALKVEQSLTTQTYQLQQERRKLTAELEEAKRERDSGLKQIEQLRKEVTGLCSQLEETEWGLCQKSGEISLLKTQLKDSQGDQTTRGHELLHLRAQVRQYQQEVERRRAEISSLHDLTAQLRREVSELRTQLDQSQHACQKAHTQDQELSHKMEKVTVEVENLRREKDVQLKSFDEERRRWVEEKERVIRYQKQLHHNYISMLNRNRQLEEEVARLTGVPLPPLSNKGQAVPSSYVDIKDGQIAVNGDR